MKLYKLTSKDGRSYCGCQWGANVVHTTDGKGDLCGPGYLHAYTDLLLAVLLNPIHAGLRDPQAWEAEGEVKRTDRGLKVGCTTLKTVKQIPLPEITTEQRVRFGILCAKKVCHDPSWNAWATAWLDGSDRSEAAAAAARKAAEWAAEAARKAAEWAAEAARKAAEWAAEAAEWAAEAAEAEAAEWAAEAAEWAAEAAEAEAAEAAAEAATAATAAAAAAAAAAALAATAAAKAATAATAAAEAAEATAEAAEAGLNLAVIAQEACRPVPVGLPRGNGAQK
jgi:hypothetical protein